MKLLTGIGIVLLVILFGLFIGVLIITILEGIREFNEQWLNVNKESE